MKLRVPRPMLRAASLTLGTWVETYLHADHPSDPIVTGILQVVPHDGHELPELKPVIVTLYPLQDFQALGRVVVEPTGNPQRFELSRAQLRTRGALPDEFLVQATMDGSSTHPEVEVTYAGTARAQVGAEVTLHLERKVASRPPPLPGNPKGSRYSDR